MAGLKYACEKGLKGNFVNFNLQNSLLILW